jgi:hypothetical protein
LSPICTTGAVDLDLALTSLEQSSHTNQLPLMGACDDKLAHFFEIVLLTLMMTTRNRALWRLPAYPIGGDLPEINLIAEII